MESYLKSLLTGRDADYLEIRIEESQLNEMAFRGRKLEDLGQSTAYGGNVRALVNGGWGFVSFNSMDNLEKKVDLAIDQARIIGRNTDEKTELAPVSPIRDVVRAELDSDPAQVPLSRKRQVVEEYHGIILDTGEEIKSSAVTYFDRSTRLTFANSEETYIQQDKVDLALGLGAAATRSGLTQTFGHALGGSSGFDLVLNQQDKARDAAERAIAMLDAPSIQGGQYTVILDPGLAGVFVHEAFGHLSEADDLFDNPNLRELMKLGTVYGPPNLSIYDSGLHRGTRGFLKYDDEGVPTEKTYLIKEGELVGRLHSRESAGRLGEKPTGNARALDYRFRPICRMRTTCIEPADASFEDMLAGVKRGVYAVSSQGGQTNGEMFTFTAGEALMIRDGQIAERVRDVTLTGNVFTTLGNIDMIGADLLLKDGPGGCGKGSQSPLPITTGSPHIRIQNVVIGGRK